MMAAARALQLTLKPRVPLIKFRKGGPADQDAHVKPSNEPATATSTLSFNQREIAEDIVPAKYSRKPLTDIEIQYIMRGGPE